MAMLSGTTKLTTDLVYKKTTGTLSTPSESLGYSDAESWSSTNADVLYSERITLNAGNSYTATRDLYGSLTDSFGDTVNLVTVRELIIVNRSGTATENVTVSGDFIVGDPLGGTTPTIVIGPGGRCVLSSPIDGYAVTETSGDEITLTSDSDELSVDLIIIGKA